MHLTLTSDRQFHLDHYEEKSLAQAFKKSPASGLLELLKQPTFRHSSESSAYWYEYIHQFFKTFCAFADTDPLLIPVNQDYLEGKEASAPMVKGSEYITQDFLEDLWLETQKLLLQSLKAFPGSTREFIAKAFPEWANAGKIYFHLAESKNPETKPFVFLATYSVRVSGKARVQHRPLASALQDSVDMKDPKHLKLLLSPIYELSHKSEFIAAALKKQKDLHPLLFRP